MPPVEPRQVHAAHAATPPDPGLAGVIALRDVCKVYEMGHQQVHALRGVDLTLQEGSFTAIMGPSGSGKSTMMNLLGCLDRPTSGQYFLRGQDVSNLRDDALSGIRLKYIGYIFQSFNLITQLTVQENIELPLYYQGWEPARSAQRARELAEQVGLQDRLMHRPAELSGGQQQRVAVARSLANDPALLLADEPTGNLDSATGEAIMTLLCSLNEQGKTIVLVTHEPDIAAHARTRIIMRDGRIDTVEGEYAEHHRPHVVMAEGA